MRKSNSSSIIETLKRYFEIKNSSTVFSHIAPELSELYAGYQALIALIDSKKDTITDRELYEKLLAMEFSLKESSFILINMLEAVTNRQIAVHISKCDENLLKIAQKYHCDILEILELNKMNKIYSLEDGKAVLIPVKYL